MKTHRETKDWTQQDAADRLGIARSYYCMVEAGKRMPSVRVARKLEKVFGIEWHLWFDGIEA